MKRYFENTNPEGIVIELSDIFDGGTCRPHRCWEEVCFQKRLVREVRFAGLRQLAPVMGAGKPQRDGSRLLWGQKGPFGLRLDIDVKWPQGFRHPLEEKKQFQGGLLKNETHKGRSACLYPDRLCRIREKHIPSRKWWLEGVLSWGSASALRGLLVGLKVS